LIKRFEQQKHAPQVTLVVEGEVYRQPPDRELALFRVVQETLNNAYKHAQAKTILITLEFAQDFIKVNVLDDGLGFTVSADFSQLAIEGHLGLVGMQERMAAVGGQWWIRSEPEQGCQVSALCPRLEEGQTAP
jgi:signal transduction histidine kinase